jgi:hypothetical protein
LTSNSPDWRPSIVTDQPCGLSTLPTVLDHFVQRADRASVGRVVEDKAPYAPIQRNGIDKQANFAIRDYCGSEPAWPHCHIIQLNEKSRRQRRLFCHAEMPTGASKLRPDSSPMIYWTTL